MRIENSDPDTDSVFTSSLPETSFTGMAAFTLDANAGAGNGADTITLETRNGLSGPSTRKPMPLPGFQESSPSFSTVSLPAPA